MLIGEYSIARVHSSDELRSAVAYAARTSQEAAEEASGPAPRLLQHIQGASQRAEELCDIPLFGRVVLYPHLGLEVDSSIFGLKET